MKKIIIFLLVLILATLAYMAFKPKPNLENDIKEPTGQTNTTNNSNSPDYQSQGQPSVTIISPISGSTFKVGSTIVIKWKTENIPKGSFIDVGGWGQNGALPGWRGDPATGTASFTIPATVCGGECGASIKTELDGPYRLQAIVSGPWQDNIGYPTLTKSEMISINIVK